MNYRWRLLIDIKGLEEFKTLSGMQVQLNIKEVWLLSFIIEIYLAKKGINSSQIKGSKYIYITDRLILKNLKYLDVKPRQLKAMIGKLCELGYLSRIIKDYNKRYLKVNQELLNRWNKNSDE